MSNISKRILTVLLAVCAVLTLICAVVFCSGFRAVIFTAEADENTRWTVSGMPSWSSCPTGSEPKVEYDGEDWRSRVLVSIPDAEILVFEEESFTTDGSAVPIEGIIVDAGRYRFVVKGTGDENTGSDYIILTIQPKVIDLSDLSCYWRLQGSYGQMMSITVYHYTYRQNGTTYDFYATTEINSAPDNDWTDWMLVNPIPVNNSVIVWRETNFNPQIEFVVNSVSTPFKPITEEDHSAIGCYTSQVTIPKKENYVWEVSKTEDSYRGLTFTVNADESITVEKTWYVAHNENALMNAKESEEVMAVVGFALSDWTFGTDEVPEAPRLQHGDELFGLKQNDSTIQPPGYMLYVGDTVENAVQIAEVQNDGVNWLNEDFANGNDDILTFTLFLNDEQISPANSPRSQWNYYFNRFMPAGKYTVVFSVKAVKVASHCHWWDGFSHVVGEELITCAGFERTFEFTVMPQNLTITGASASPEAIDTLYVKDISNTPDVTAGDYSWFFNGIYDYVEFSETIKREDVLKSETFWGRPENAEEYFDKQPNLIYNLWRMLNNTYLPADSSVWAGYFVKPDTFHVYYQAEMKNYVFDWIGDLHDLAVEVVFYRVLAKPQLVTDTLVYTGRVPSVVGKTDENQIHYTLIDSTPVDENGNETPEVGDYIARFVLREPEHYRWEGQEEWTDGNDEFEVPYWIVPAHVVLPTLSERYYSKIAQKPDIPIQLDSFNNPIYTVDSESFADGYTDAGTYRIPVILRDSKNYKWVDAEDNEILVDPNDNAGTAYVIFKINKALNEWIVPVRVSDWYWNGYEYSNTLSAVPRTGRVTYRVTYDEAGERPYSGLDEFYAENGVVSSAVSGQFNRMPKGTYYLWAEVTEEDAGKNDEPLLPAYYEFQVLPALNVWTVNPAIISWMEGEEPNYPTGSAKFGTADFVIWENETQSVVYSSMDNIDLLSSAAAGWYTLSATVADGANYNGIASTVVTFRIFNATANAWHDTPNIQGWREGEEANLPIASTIIPSEITYLYKQAGASDATATQTAPSAAGDYVLIVRAEAEGYQPLVARVEFTIFAAGNKTNGWLQEPSIADWREGETRSVPIAEALHGEVAFSYLSQSGDPIEPPTAAGYYILVSSVEAIGYEPLISRIPFQILPANITVERVIKDANGNSVTVRVEGLAQGTTVEVHAVSERENGGEYASASQAVAALGYHMGAVYNIVLKDSFGAPVQPSGAVKVTISYSSSMPTSAMKVAHIGKNGEAELLSAVVNGGNISFTTAEFSTFCLVWQEAQGVDNTVGVLAVVLLFIVIAVLLVVDTLVLLRLKGVNIKFELNHLKFKWLGGKKHE